MGQTMNKMINRKELGQNLFLFAGAFTAIMSLFMLVVDFGGAAMTYHKAQVATDSAAFAAAQGVDIDWFYFTQEIRLDTQAASSLAGRYASINSQGVNVQVVGVYVANDKVYVRTVAYYDSFFAHFIGLSRIQMNLVSSATPAFGIAYRGE